MNFCCHVSIKDDFLDSAKQTAAMNASPELKNISLILETPKNKISHTAEIRSCKCGGEEQLNFTGII